MFEVNDNIMYGMVGVCKVVDIVNESLMDDIQKDYYVLNTVYSKNTVIKIPLDNEKDRNEKFKQILKSGECQELMKVLKSIYLNKEDKKIAGKKVSKNDEDIKNTAEKLINEEFAHALNISPEEVPEYILSRIS